jgi:hypothetical protein
MPQFATGWRLTGTGPPNRGSAKAEVVNSQRGTGGDGPPLVPPSELAASRMGGDDTGMNESRNAEVLNAQLTIAHWYLDRAQATSADQRCRYLARAREAYDILVRLMAALHLTSEQRRRIGVEAANLAQRLESPPQRDTSRADSTEIKEQVEP